MELILICDWGVTIIPRPEGKLQVSVSLKPKLIPSPTAKLQRRQSDSHGHYTQ